MAVGQTVEVPYTLPGPLPAGNYVVSAGGFQMSGDAQVHIDVLLRPSSGADQIIVSTDGNNGDGGVNAEFNATLAGVAVNARCGDRVVLRAKMTGGSSNFIEFATGLTIP